MPAAYQAVGDYTAATEIVSAAAQTEILALVEVLGGLIDINQSASGSEAEPSPEFDRIPVTVRLQLRAEIDALKVAIDAAPTA